jgi:hypothetical protein
VRGVATWEPSTARQFHCARNRYCPNDDNIEALGFGARYSGNMNAFMLLSDQTICATIARIVRQSGPERQGVNNR